MELWWRRKFEMPKPAPLALSAWSPLSCNVDQPAVQVDQHVVFSKSGWTFWSHQHNSFDILQEGLPSWGPVLTTCGLALARPLGPLCASFNQPVYPDHQRGVGGFVCLCQRECVCVCVCLFHGLSESSAISCIVLPLIEPKSGPLSGIAVCSCVCVCLAAFPELSVPQDHRLASPVLLLCVCVRPGATTTGRPTVSKERCVCVCVCLCITGVGRLPFPALNHFLNSPLNNL